jgi:hypothetical protein
MHKLRAGLDMLTRSEIFDRANRDADPTRRGAELYGLEEYCSPITNHEPDDTWRTYSGLVGF